MGIYKIFIVEGSHFTLFVLHFRLILFPVCLLNHDCPRIRRRRLKCDNCLIGRHVRNRNRRNLQRHDHPFPDCIIIVIIVEIFIPSCRLHL